MIRAIGETLPIITGIMISPVPIAGLIVVLTSKRGPIKSVAFGLGFFAALWLPTFLLAWGGQKIIAVSGSGSVLPMWGNRIYAGVGVLLLALGCWVFIKHSSKMASSTEPKWLKTIDSASMLMVFGFGSLLVYLNPKNLPLVISAAVDYAQASLSTAQLATVVTVFAVMGSLLIFLPIVLAHLARKSSARLFDKMRPWLIAHNKVILAVICVVVGVAMLGKAFAVLV